MSPERRLLCKAFMRIGLLLLLAACEAGTVRATLDELPNLNIVVGSYAQVDTDTDRTRPTSARILLQYDTDAFLAAHDHLCASIGGVTGEVNGAPLELESEGYTDDEYDPVSCGIPILVADVLLATDSMVNVSLRDPTLEITTSGLMEARIATLRSPATDWQFAPGDRVAIGWSHPTDFALEKPFSWIVFRTPDYADFFEVTPELVDDEIRFSIPTSTTAVGDGVFDFTADDLSEPAMTCTGVASCTFHASREYRHAASVR